MERRDFLIGTGALGLASLAARSAVAAGSRVRDENAKPGTRDWLLTNARVDSANKIRCPWIEGYCSKTSAAAGDKIDVKVSTNPAAKFTLDLYRLGYYGGAGGRLIERFGPLAGSPQPDPPVGDVRLRECKWETALTITVGS